MTLRSTVLSVQPEDIDRLRVDLSMHFNIEKCKVMYVRYNNPHVDYGRSQVGNCIQRKRFGSIYK